jgi:hypothetical protein
MMKLKNIRFILSDVVFFFYDSMVLISHYFINSLLTFVNKIRNEKAAFQFQLLKNQHLEKMLVFFWFRIRRSWNVFLAASFYLISTPFTLEYTKISLTCN